MKMETLHTKLVPTPKQLDLTFVKALRVLGKGAMGTVFLAYDVLDRSLFALKVADKTSSASSLRRALWETSLLSSLSLSPHPFLPSLLSSFDSPSLIGWSLPFCPGGDLNSLRLRHPDRSFSPSAIKFYLAEILCALARLHSLGIVYRDLKPENVLVQSSGHVTLTDFDLSCRLNRKQFGSEIPDFDSPVSKQRRPLMKTKSARVSPMSRRRDDRERSNSFVGTEEYVSPEMIRGEGHEFAVDWWALGVLAYEMLYGKTPFRGTNKKETFRNVLFKQPEFVGKRTALIDLIERLLKKDPVRRLGYHGGAEEIKEHEFFRGLRWDLLTEVLRPPFVPSTDEAETAAAGGFDVTEYFKGLKAPKPPSGNPSFSSSDSETDVSLTEF